MTTNHYRKMFHAEERMIRAMMPRTAAIDTAPLTSPILPAQAERRVWRAGRSYVEKSGFTMREVLR